MAANAQGVVEIRHKDGTVTEYVLIAERLRRFREEHAELAIETVMLESGNPVVFKTTISDGEHIIATGHAEEDRNLGNINKTSALENCETSSVGRALAFFGGEYSGSTIRSADEMADALEQQRAQEHIKYMHVVREEWHSIHAIKMSLGDDPPKIDAAREAFKELDQETQILLWRAPSKGGVFTTEERKLLKEG